MNPKDGYLIVDKEKALSHLRGLKMFIVSGKHENITVAYYEEKISEEYENGYIAGINDAIDYLQSCPSIGEVWADDHWSGWSNNADPDRD